MKRFAAVLFFLFAALTLFANGEEEWDAEGWKSYPSLDGFTGVELRTEAELLLVPGDEWHVRVRGDRYDVEDLDLFITGRVLVIRRQSLVNFLSSGRRLEIEVTMPRLSRVVCSSSGLIRTTDRFEVHGIELIQSGSGSLVFDGVADAVDCRISGSGKVEMTGRANVLDVKLSGSGTGDFAVTSNVTDILMSGSGDLRLRGSTDIFDIRVSGSGTIMADDYEARLADIVISGAGEIGVRVNRNLDVSISGTGSVYYSGDPRVEVRGTGHGRVMPR